MRLRRETGDFSLVIKNNALVNAPVRKGLTAEDLVGLVVIIKTSDELMGEDATEACVITHVEHNLSIDGTSDYRLKGVGIANDALFRYYPATGVFTYVGV